MKLVITINDDLYDDYLKRGATLPKYGTAIGSLYEALWNGVPLPEQATNGDMIKAMFPNVEVKEKNNGYEVYFGIGTAIQFFNHQWWNAPYSAKSEVNADEEN